VLDGHWSLSLLPGWRSAPAPRAAREAVCAPPSGAPRARRSPTRFDELRAIRAAAVDRTSSTTTLSDEAPVAQNLNHVARALTSQGELAREQWTTGVPERRTRSLRRGRCTTACARRPRRTPTRQKRSLHALHGYAPNGNRLLGGHRRNGRLCQRRGAHRSRRRTTTSGRDKDGGRDQPRDEGVAHGDRERNPPLSQRQASAGTSARRTEPSLRVVMLLERRQPTVVDPCLM
jgi:hypothetical protein